MRKSVLLIIVVMLVGIILLTGCINTEKKDVLKTQEKRVAKFLKEKYGQEFIIGESSYYRRALGDPYSIRTEITSYDEPLIEFTVMSDEHGNPYGETVFWPELGGANFGGSYIEMKWQQEASEFYKPIADEIFGADVLLSVEINLPQEYYQSIKGKIPSYHEFIESGEKIERERGNTYHFSLIGFKNMMETDFNKEEKKMEEFITKISERQIEYFDATSTYFDISTEKHIRNFIDLNVLRGIKIVKNVEGGPYGSNIYEKVAKEDYFIGLSVKKIENINFEKLISRYKKY